MALAWLTPNVAEFAGSLVGREIILPGNLYFYVTGALSLLAEESNWEKFGDADPEETSQFFATILDGYLMSNFASVGMIASFVSPSLSFGWYEMNGQVLSAAAYPELADAVPDAWKSGGNITLPDMAGGHSVVHNGSQLGFDAGIVGSLSGESAHALIASEIPEHSH